MKIKTLAILYYLFLALVILMGVLIFTNCAHGHGIPDCEFDGSCGLEAGPTVDQIDYFPEQSLPEELIQRPKKQRRKK